MGSFVGPVTAFWRPPAALDFTEEVDFAMDLIVDVSCWLAWLLRRLLVADMASVWQATAVAVRICSSFVRADLCALIIYRVEKCNSQASKKIGHQGNRHDNSLAFQASFRSCAVLSLIQAGNWRVLCAVAKGLRCVLKLLLQCYALLQPHTA